MGKPLSEDIQVVVEELEEEQAAKELAALEVEALLRDLQADSFDARYASVKQLARLEKSSTEIVGDQPGARETDPTYKLRKRA